MPEARFALAQAARGTMVADERLASVYEYAASRSMETSDTYTEYKQQMRKYDEAEAALRTVRAALVAAEEAIRAVEAGKDKGWEVALACSLSAVKSLIDAVAAIGLDIPPPLTQAVTLLGPLAQEACSGEL